MCLSEPKTNRQLCSFLFVVSKPEGCKQFCLFPFASASEPEPNIRNVFVALFLSFYSFCLIQQNMQKQIVVVKQLAGGN